VADIVYTTNDISIAAFLLMKGLSLLNADRGNGKFVFSFSDPDNKGQHYVLEFAATPFAQYDAYLRTLRSLIRK
jgi:hypothetical protein